MRLSGYILRSIGWHFGADLEHWAWHHGLAVLSFALIVVALHLFHRAWRYHRRTTGRSR